MAPKTEENNVLRVGSELSTVCTHSCIADDLLYNSKTTRLAQLKKDLNVKSSVY